MCRGSREGGRHMFFCRVGHHLRLVTHLKTKNYSSRLKQTWRRIHPSQIVCKYKPQKSRRWEPELEPSQSCGGTYTLLLAGCLYAVIFMVGIFLPPLVNFNSERLPTSTMLSSDIRGSKRRIKDGFLSRWSHQSCWTVYSVITGSAGRAFF